MQEKYQLDSDQKRDKDTGQRKCWDIVASGYRKWWKQIEGNGNKNEGAQKDNY
jgi:hypothetical protein